MRKFKFEKDGVAKELNTPLANNQFKISCAEVGERVEPLKAIFKVDGITVGELEQPISCEVVNADNIQPPYLFKDWQIVVEKYYNLTFIETYQAILLKFYIDESYEEPFTVIINKKQVIKLIVPNLKMAYEIISTYGYFNFEVDKNYLHDKDYLKFSISEMPITTPSCDMYSPTLFYIVEEDTEDFETIFLLSKLILDNEKKLAINYPHTHYYAIKNKILIIDVGLEANISKSQDIRIKRLIELGYVDVIELSLNGTPPNSPYYATLRKDYIKCDMRNLDVILSYYNFYFGTIDQIKEFYFYYKGQIIELENGILNYKFAKHIENFINNVGFTQTQIDEIPRLDVIQYLLIGALKRINSGEYNITEANIISHKVYFGEEIRIISDDGYVYHIPYLFPKINSANKINIENVYHPELGVIATIENGILKSNDNGASIARNLNLPFHTIDTQNSSAMPTNLGFIPTIINPNLYGEKTKEEYEYDKREEENNTPFVSKTSTNISFNSGSLTAINPNSSSFTLAEDDITLLNEIETKADQTTYIAPAVWSIKLYKILATFSNKSIFTNHFEDIGDCQFIVDGLIEFKDSGIVKQTFLALHQMLVDFVSQIVGKLELMELVRSYQNEDDEIVNEYNAKVYDITEVKSIIKARLDSLTVLEFRYNVFKNYIFVPANHPFFQDLTDEKIYEPITSTELLIFNRIAKAPIEFQATGVEKKPTIKATFTENENDIEISLEGISGEDSDGNELTSTIPNTISFGGL